jgi:hypothetical protein
MFIFLVMIIIFLVFFIPSIAEPTDVALDQQVELGVPGVFRLVDTDQDRKAESLQFSFEIKAYREGNFIVSGNLEGMKNGHWVALGTTVIPFQWSPKATTVELNFMAGNIVKYKISGPYRVMIGLKEGGWELPLQIAGFSAQYSWKDFSNAGAVTKGEITTMSEAKTAAETWARFQALNPGKLREISYNYDRWQLDYQRQSGEIMRFLVSPQGTVELLRIPVPRS